MLRILKDSLTGVRSRRSGSYRAVGFQIAVAKTVPRERLPLPEKDDTGRSSNGTDNPDRARVDPAVVVRPKVRPLYSLGAGWSCNCQRFCQRAEAFACFLDDVTFAVGTITLCTGMTVGCPGSIPSC